MLCIITQGRKGSELPDNGINWFICERKGVIIRHSATPPGDLAEHPKSRNPARAKAIRAKYE